MDRLRLDADALEVQTFPAEPAAAAAGTARAREEAEAGGGTSRPYQCFCTVTPPDCM